MYKEFFGLQRLPFNLTPDPDFLFLPPKHGEALAGLGYAITGRKGFVVLTGDAGTGKTTLLNAILNQLSTEKVQSSVILNPTLSPSEFLEIVLLDFGIADVPTSKAQKLWKLQELLLQAYREDRIAVLVIDEAHKLSLELLEEIRLLGNYEYGADKFLQIVLLGQTELDVVLDRQDLRQFKQRIALRLYIDPMTTSEIEHYISFRWQKAGASGPVPFLPDAVLAIAEYSRGIPRLINSLCDTALLMACGDAAHTIGMSYIRDAAMNLSLMDEPAAPEPAPAFSGAVGRHDHRHTSRSSSVPENFPKNDGLRAIPVDDYLMPTLAQYQTSRANSSWLKRLAGRFTTH